MQAPVRLYGRTHNANGYPRLVQIGWILTDDRDNILSSQTLYVQPSGFSIPANVVQFNGISTEYALEHGLTLLDVLHLFSDVLDIADTVIGHNIEYDINVLVGELRRKNQRKAILRLNSLPVVDTMKSSVKFCAIPCPPDRHYGNGSEYKYPRLQELHTRLFGCTFDNAHDAMADIEATRRCYIELQKRGVIDRQIQN